MSAQVPDSKFVELYRVHRETIVYVETAICVVLFLCVDRVLNVVKKRAPPWPVVECGDSLYILVSDIDKALVEAVKIAVDALSRTLNIE